MRIASLVLDLVLVLPALGGAEQQPLAPETQIAAAVQAAPKDRRAGATLLAYDGAGLLPYATDRTI